MGKWVSTGGACPCGKSSDAYAVDENNNGYCFSGKCGGKPFINNKDAPEDKSLFSAEYFPHRGLNKLTLEKYGTLTKFFSGSPIETAFFYPNGAIKVRGFVAKTFRTQGDFTNTHLFGKNIFDKGSKR